MIQIFDSEKLPDFIGDIHGNYNHLIQLLIKLGYQKSNNLFVHPKRIPVFLGDYINRGPDSLEVLNLISNMQKSGLAYALMGNHEFNFLAYHFKNERGEYFRPNNERYYGYIASSKKPIDESGRLDEFINWMTELPLIIKGEHFNAVHAQWNKSLELYLMKFNLKKMDELTMQFIYNNENLLNTISDIIRGNEFELTSDFKQRYGLKIQDKKLRFLWWKQNRTFYLYDWLDVGDDLRNIIIDPKEFDTCYLNEINTKPTFFGHYWLKPKDFGLISPSLCCLDFSVANGGFIGTYRFHNEETLVAENLFRN